MLRRQLHRRTDGDRERGAVLIQVALAMAVLCGFCAMATDYGLLMVARGQAQTAADAGALSGAIALGFDDVANATSARQSARAVAGANLVARGPAHVTDADVQVNGFPMAGFPPPPQNPLTWLNRVTVSAYRNQAHGNALPTFFGRLVGIGDQGVRATATAMMVPSNASDCVWPIAIPDKWQNNIAPASTFDKYDASGVLTTPRDTYTAPSFVTFEILGPGFQPGLFSPVRFDQSLTLTDVALFTQNLDRGRFVPVQVPRHDGGGFASNLASCNNSDDPVKIEVAGDVERLNVEVAGTRATVLAAAAERVAADPTATWNPTTFHVDNSCAGEPTPCAPMSPRLVVLPLFDVNRYEDTRWTAGVPGATPKIRVVNFVGFFIKRVIGTSIEGQLTIAPGRFVFGKPMVSYRSSFLRTAFLSR